MKELMGPIKMMMLVVGGIVALTAVISFAFGSPYTIDSGTRGVVMTFGEITDVVSEGLHFKWPFAQKVVIVDVRTQKASAPASAGTRDLQNVQTEVALNYHLDGERLQTIVSQFGLDVESRIIDPRIQEVVKAVIARYSAEDLLKKRDVVKSEIVIALKSSIAPYHIVVEDIQITNFQFSKSFDAAIEAKQTAEQAALKAKNDLDRIRVEAEQTIATAKAQAEAIRIQSEAVRQQGGREYVQLQAISKWNGELPQYVGGNGPIPFIDVKK